MEAKKDCLSAVRKQSFIQWLKGRSSSYNTYQRYLSGVQQVQENVRCGSRARAAEKGPRKGKNDKSDVSE